MHGEGRALDLEKRGGHQKHQRRITALDFSPEEELEDLGHLGLSRVRCFDFHPCKVLAEGGKAETAVSHILSLRFLGLGFGLSTFLDTKLLGPKGACCGGQRYFCLSSTHHGTWWSG
jgi:hypothetical protein